jgi:Domain of unknown function (DUF4412)
MQRSVLAGVVTIGFAMGGVVPTVASAQAFEGVIHYTIHDDEGKTTEIVQASRHGKMRFGAIENGQESGMIVDSTAGTVTFVDGKNKSYMVINRQMMDQMRGMTRGMTHNMRRQAQSDDDRASGKVTRTGRTEVVAGVRCEVWAYDGMDDGHHETGEACLAKGVGMLAMGGMGLDMLGGQDARQAMQERYKNWGEVGNLLAQGYGILRAKSFRDGKPNGSIEVTSIERGAPSDAQFQPPAGYKQQSMMGGPPH